ncbi:hypothetical protein VTL71DRAFT_146 [Oculimacula yallundae]|uniref:Integral membrane protein n=1 Tax=Oculimacula yallundae TaxID=86028 RepID=A0ABR4CZ94_9HELO
MGISHDLGQHEFFRSSTYENNPNYNPNYDSTKAIREPDTARTKGDWKVAEEEESRRARSIVDYADYKAKCETMRIAITERPVSYFDMKDNEEEPRRIKMGFVEGIVRMATIYPYRDMDWLVKIIFAVGSTSFLVNAIFGYRAVVAPESLFDGELTLAIPATLTCGAVLFLIGGYMQMLARFNAFGLRNQGGVEVVKEKSMEITRDPLVAMLGSKEWMWFPTSAEYRIMSQDTFFKADLILFIGGHIFSIATVAGFPGVIDFTNPANLFLIQATIFFPQVVGGTFFFVASLIGLVTAQRAWYVPNMSDLDWQGAFWNSLGAAGFVLAGATLIVLPTVPLSTALASLIGSWAFLLGGLIQWFVLMREYPRGR